MKKLYDDKTEGLLKLLGENILIYCCRYIYFGKLEGVNEDCLLLKNPHIVYETGEYSDNKFETVESLNVDEWYIQLDSIESFGLSMEKV